MKIYLKNTLTGEKEEFQSIRDREVSMYHCGPTVYARQHIGNLKAYVFADLLRRLFEFNNYKINQVINITDVGHLTSDSDSGDDKIEKAAENEVLKKHNLNTSEKLGESETKEVQKLKKNIATEIAEKYTNIFFTDIEKMNIEKSKITFPKATDHIAEQLDLIKILNEKGFVYKTSDGLYFNTSKFDKYGVLGNVQIDKLKEGARIGINKEKKNPTDFALWKFSKPEDARAQEWDSDWGVGFPGWHLECSAMSAKFLGQPFDIHTGGIDHIQIHHNNEIAQSEAAHNEHQANYWMHVNHLILDGEKISKSLGNGLFLEDLEKEHISPAEYRYWLLTSHYSTLINFTWDAVKGSATAFNKLINHFKKVSVGEINKDYLEKITEKLNDDLDTPGAIALIWEMMKDDDFNDSDKLATILETDKVLGLNIIKLLNTEIEIPKEVMELVNKRKEARINKNFQESDEIRDQISKLGYEILDKGEEFEVREK